MLLSYLIASSFPLFQMFSNALSNLLQDLALPFHSNDCRVPLLTQTSFQCQLEGLIADQLKRDSSTTNTHESM